MLGCLQRHEFHGKREKVRKKSVSRGNCILHTSCTQIKIIIRFYFIVCEVYPATIRDTLLVCSGLVMKMAGFCSRGEKKLRNSRKTKTTELKTERGKKRYECFRCMIYRQSAVPYTYNSKLLFACCTLIVRSLYLYAYLSAIHHLSHHI